MNKNTKGFNFCAIFEKNLKVKNILTILGLFFCGLLLNAQVVYSSEWKSEADVVVYVSEWKSDADLVVYKTEWKSEASKNSGIWFFTEWKSDAKKMIYFTEWKSDADVIIYFTDWKSEAGWKNLSKRYYFD